MRTVCVATFIATQASTSPLNIQLDSKPFCIDFSCERKTNNHEDPYYHPPLSRCRHTRRSDDRQHVSKRKVIPFSPSFSFHSISLRHFPETKPHRHTSTSAPTPASKGTCSNQQLRPGKCYNVDESWNDKLSSAGPDEGQALYSVPASWHIML